MTKSRSFYNVFYFQIIFLETLTYFLGMFMLIRLSGTLAQTRVWVGRLNTLERVPCGVSMSFLLQNTVIYMDVFYLNYYFWRLSLLIALNSKVGTLAQNIIGLGRVTFSSKGPIRGQFVFLTTKYRNLYGHFLFPLLFPQSQPLNSFK